MRFRLLCTSLIASALAMVGTGCEKKAKSPPPPSGEEPALPAQAGETPQPKRAPTPSPPAPPQRRVAVSTQPPPAELWREFGGQRALEMAAKLVAIGPRPAGSAESDAARRLLFPALEGSAWEVERVPFEATSPSGPIRGVNLIARFSAEGFRPVPRTPRSVLIVAAYDTRQFSTIRFVGANDGASGPAMLVELARVLSLNPRMAERVELLFADASEPRQQFTLTDGVAGSRNFLSTIDPKSLRRVLVLGGVGATGEPLTAPPDTAPEIWQEVTQGCVRLGRPGLIRKLDRYVWGDHVPFVERGIPSLYLGNHEYMARYTADDRIEKLSTQTLEQVGQFATWLVAQWAQR